MRYNFRREKLRKPQLLFTSLKYTDYLNDPITLEEIMEEVLMIKSVQAALTDWIARSCNKLN